MKTNRIFEAMAGDKQSKLELQKASRKALKCWVVAAIVLTSIIFIIMRWYGPIPTIIPTLVFSLLIGIPVGSIVGSCSFTFFTRHLKFTLPESIAPRVEMRHPNNE